MMDIWIHIISEVDGDVVEDEQGTFYEHSPMTNTFHWDGIDGPKLPVQMEPVVIITQIEDSDDELAELPDPDATAVWNIQTSSKKKFETSFTTPLRGKKRKLSSEKSSCSSASKAKAPLQVNMIKYLLGLENTTVNYTKGYF